MVEIMTPHDKWLSVEEIAAYLGISKETVYRWLEREKIPAHRVGKQWRFKVAEVDQWVKEGGAAEPVQGASSTKRKPRNA